MFLARTEEFYAAMGVQYMQEMDTANYLLHCEVRHWLHLAGACTMTARMGASITH